MSESPLAFNGRGILPVGDYQLTLEQLSQSILVTGSDDVSLDTKWRLKLTTNLGILVRQLWHVGIERIFIDGSFVEDKPHPNDIDGYFECDEQFCVSGELQRQLHALSHPQRIWVWGEHDRIFMPGSIKPQLPMWHLLRVELYPHYGQGSGIPDKFGNE